MDKDKLSYGLHDQTERPCQKLPLDAHEIIKQRYLMAERLARNKCVLEVGAGHGIAMNFIANAASNYIAGEFSVENIELIKSRESGIDEVVQMDAHHIPFKGESFDLIIAMAMIYYLEIEEFIREVKRLLKRDGILFFCTSNKDIAGFVPAPFTTGYYSVPELNFLLERHGFESKFYGAFLSPGKSGLYGKIRTLLRDMAKYFIFKLPWGRRYWQSMRNRYLGGTEELPWDLEDIHTEEVSVDLLDPSVIDRSHRIIYCEASLKSKSK